MYERNTANCNFIAANDSSSFKNTQKAPTQKVGRFRVDEMALNNHRGDHYRVIPLHRLRCNGMVHVPSITGFNGKNVFTRARVRCLLTGDIKLSRDAI